jgi:hypothetical protein
VGHALAENAIQFGMHAFHADTQAFQDASGNPFTLAQQAKEDMLSADILVTK